jgi:NodT family efflux transporter outer membrane factor (OMF) lipoprotein
MSGSRSNRWPWLAPLGTVAAALLAGCTQGPDFTPPTPPTQNGYTAEPATAETVATAGPGGVAQHFEPGAEIAGDWWHLFGSPDLDAVIKAAIENSPTLAQARATLRQAHEAVRAANGALLPQVDASAGLSRDKVSLIQFGEKLSAPAFTLYSVGATVQYSLDIFGAEHRTVEAEAALEEMERDELSAAYLTLTGNAVATTVTIASTREEIRAVEDIISADEQNLHLVDLAVRAGSMGAESPEYLSAVTQLANDRNLLPPLRQALDQASHALAVLTGRAPADWAAPSFDFSGLTLPTTLPVSLPASLVEQRPDILAASADLHSSSAQIGVAAAHLLPNVTISAGFTYNALTPNQLFSPIGILNDVAGGVTAPLFHGGTLAAQKRAAEAAYDAADARYRQTVLEALRQVADVLRGLDHDAMLTQGEERAVAAAERGLDSARRSLRAGAGGYTPVLDATRQYQEARIGYVHAIAQRYQDTAQLFVAMGGGWWHAPDIEAGSKS